MTRPTTVHDTLVAARALIALPMHWTKFKARITRPTYTCWCAAGAVMEVLELHEMAGDEETNRIFTEAMRALDEQVQAASSMDSVVVFNDHLRSTHAHVLAIYDRAIGAAA